MKTEVFICVLCACLVTPEESDKRPDTKDFNKFTFLSHQPTEIPKTQNIFNSFTFLSHGPTKTTEQGPEANPVNGSIYGQMTNHTSFNKTEENILERVIWPNLAENEWPQNHTQN